MSPSQSVFSQAEREVFVKYVDIFRGGNKTARKSLLVEKVLPAVKALNPQLSSDQWKLRKSQIKQWFHNNGRRKATGKQPTIDRRVSLKQVVAHARSNEVKAKVEELSNAASGTPAFLSKYQQGLQEIVDGLDDDELEALEDQRTQWEKDKYPEEVQKRNARTKLPHYLKMMAEKMNRVHGSKCLILEYHAGEDSRLWVKLHDFTGGDNLPSFSTKDPTAADELQASFHDYVAHIEELGENNGSSVVAPDRRSVVALLDLEKDAQGYPILPDLPEGGEDLQTMKGLVRSYITAHYRLACGRPFEKVPWGCIAKDPTRFLESSGLPPLFHLADPSGMRKDALGVLLTYWRDRETFLPASSVLHFTNVSMNGRTDETRPASYEPQTRRNRRQRVPRQSNLRRNAGNVTDPDDDDDDEEEFPTVEESANGSASENEENLSEFTTAASAPPTEGTFVFPSVWEQAMDVENQIADHINPLPHIVTPQVSQQAIDPVLLVITNTETPRIGPSAETMKKRSIDRIEDVALGRGKRKKILKINFADIGKPVSRKGRSRSQRR